MFILQYVQAEPEGKPLCNTTIMENYSFFDFQQEYLLYIEKQEVNGAENAISFRDERVT